MNKLGEVYVAEAGGVSVVIGVAVGIFFYLFLKALLGSSSHLPEIYATVAALVLSGYIGFIDDILGWKKGLPQWLKPLLTLFLAIPFMTLTLLYSQYNPFPLPNWFYALILVPIGVVGASNALNMLAGYNGLEAGLATILLFFLGLKALFLGELWIAYLAFLGVASLLAFLLFNWYPARVFPGDSLPYAMGTYLAALAILGNLEIFAAAMFLLFYLEFLLKAGAKFRAENFGVPQPDGTLKPRYKKVYSVTHLFLRFPGMTEKRLVMYILALQFVISGVVFLVFGG